jgi:hypothetical protein
LAHLFCLAIQTDLGQVAPFALLSVEDEKAPARLCVEIAVSTHVPFGRRDHVVTLLSVYVHPEQARQQMAES